MKDLDMLLNESAAGGDMFACQFNKVSNMLYRDYGVCSAHVSLIIRDILIRVSKGESILYEEVGNDTRAKR